MKVLVVLVFRGSQITGENVSCTKGYESSNSVP